MTGLEALVRARREAEERAETLPASYLVTAASAASRPIQRVLCPIPVIEAATGGGFVRGAVYLLHGGPGSGKSTLLAQAAGEIRGSAYVSAEEGVEQLGARFVRLGYPRQLLLSERDTQTALAAVGRAPLVVIDSISQMRPGVIEAAEMIVEHARTKGVAVVMVCHETKGGAHAGPRQLEHLIDCTLKLERQPRVLTVEKNRFGRAPLAWELEMTDRGFR